jgi:hypothetical protein
MLHHESHNPYRKWPALWASTMLLWLIVMGYAPQVRADFTMFHCSNTTSDNPYPATSYQIYGTLSGPKRLLDITLLINNMTYDRMQSGIVTRYSNTAPFELGFNVHFQHLQSLLLELPNQESIPNEFKSKAVIGANPYITATKMACNRM